MNKGRHGGRRPNSGRKRIKSSGVAHNTREKITPKHPIHINFKFRLTVRSDKFRVILERAIDNAYKKDLNVIVYTIQHNHVHLIAETQNNQTLSSGMKSLTRTIVILMNKGSIQLERYHLHVLKSPQETARTLNYVIYNDLKHEGRLDLNFTRILGGEKSWLLTSSLADTASATSPKRLYP